MEYNARKYLLESLLFTSSLETLHVICTEPHDKIRACVAVGFFSIAIDFCIEFWNSTFPPVLEFTGGIFLTASVRAFQWCKPRMRSCFCSKVIQVFLAANSTWTYYSYS